MGIAKDWTGDESLHRRIERYFKAINNSAEEWKCDFSPGIFSEKLEGYKAALVSSIEQKNPEQAALTLSEMRSYLNDHLYAEAFLGGRRDLGFYDTAFTREFPIHAQLDALRELVAKEAFSVENVGEELAAKAQEIFYPPVALGPWIKLVVGAAAAVGLYAWGHHNGEQSAIERLKAERDAQKAIPAEVQTGRR